MDKIKTTDNEQWAVIDGYEMYRVSTHGNVLSIERELNSRFGRRIKPKMLLKQSVRNGYPFISLCKGDTGGKGISKSVHRLVAAAFIPNPENKPFVNHIDGNRQNNMVENLEWCTPQENSTHAKDITKVYKHGTTHHAAKLTDEIVIEVRRLFNENPRLNKIELCKRYGIDKGNFYKIINGGYWGHLPVLNTTATSKAYYPNRLK